jgi:hypothetical protein
MCLPAAAALLFAALGCRSPAPADAPAPTPIDPASLVAPSQPSPDDPIFLDDFTKLRTEYGDREDFAVLCEQNRPARQLVEAFNASRWTEALALSLAWTKQCPVDIDARMVSAVSLQQLGREPESAEQKRWYNGLVDSVLASGDGKTPETAFVVISVSEEYAMLHAFGLESRGQALLAGGIDAITAEGESGPSTIYFNPAAHFRRLDRAFGIEK